MQYLKFADCVSDSTKFMINEGAELDGIIKECTEEVSPLRVGVCCLTDPKQIGGADRTPISTRFVVRYFNTHNRDTMFDYVRELSYGAMTTKFGADGTIWIDKGKKHRFDCVPASDVEDMLKEEHPDMFYMFIMDNEDNRRDVYGLFLFDEKNAAKVHRVSYHVESLTREGHQYPQIDLASVPCVGPAAFYALKELKYLT